MRDLQYMIDVMTAARDGKVVQVEGSSGWLSLRHPDRWAWDWSKHDYRIAPEPYPLPKADPKFTQTIDISMRLCLDAEQNVYVDGWQVNSKRPHGSVGSVGSGSLAPTPEPRKAREFTLIYNGDEWRVIRKPGSGEVIGFQIDVREVLPEDGK